MGPLYEAKYSPGIDHDILDFCVRELGALGAGRGSFRRVLMPSPVLFVTTSWTFVYENSALWAGEGRKRR